MLKKTLISFNNKQQYHWRHIVKGMQPGTVLWEMLTTFCPKLLSTKRSLDLLFYNFCDINHSLICSYLWRLAIQILLKCTGTHQIFIDPHCHWYFLLDTGLILWTIELFIYIQTCVNVNAYGYAIKNETLNYSSFIPLLQYDLRSDKW